MIYIVFAVGFIALSVVDIVTGRADEEHPPRPWN